jgi:hypothetical protein
METMQRLRTHPRVQTVLDERSIGKGVLVSLKTGFSFSPSADQHVFRADTATKALAAVRTAHVRRA